MLSFLWHRNRYAFFSKYQCRWNAGLNFRAWLRSTSHSFRLSMKNLTEIKTCLSPSDLSYQWCTCSTAREIPVKLDDFILHENIHGNPGCKLSFVLKSESLTCLFLSCCYLSAAFLSVTSSCFMVMTWWQVLDVESEGKSRNELTCSSLFWCGGILNCVLWCHRWCSTRNQGRPNYCERVFWISSWRNGMTYWYSIRFNQYHHLLVDVLEMIFSHVALDCVGNVISIVDTNLELNQRVYIFYPYRELDQIWCIISSKSHPIRA